MGSDSRARSVAKMLSYRIAVIALLEAITFYFTGNAGEATAITIVFNIGGSLIYYEYERLWDAVAWGKKETERTRDGLGSLATPTSPVGAINQADPAPASEPS